ncbi:hypothetical protein PF005_g33157 [Phytophthora fragariae]|uniref:Uncharacterized protein n=1 Tax=Phytophthora fragariae TaxID=53985 RepID=A0A6A3V9M0_9STRA|nr:hypothetical protein PF009_g32985 [Phytophthora fragariae]KAE8952768.1 hypothetical protein PF011_g32609 [Phytophthora fragariae]KAE9054458.1 hypothetical protein PF007_g32628 [Phytophthora fragariae]KAE9156572.1 hypothetical protein PF005_g33157 [Phytophthora fragariae]
MPKTIMTKVPRNSAKHSRMCTLCTAKRARPCGFAPLEAVASGMAGAALGVVGITA